MNQKLKNERIDVSTEKSSRSGLEGLIETIIRRFKYLGPVFVICPLFFMYLVCLTFALTPGVALVINFYTMTANLNPLIHYAAIASSLVLSYFVYVFALMTIVPIVNFLQPLKVHVGRDNWYSVKFFGWFYHNALAQLVRYTVLDLITPTPFVILYFRMMGMKIGKGVVINTTNISDPCLIQLDDYVTLGGSVHIMSHYGQSGFLVVSKTHIQEKTTVGLKASIMGDVIIGKNCMIGPHQVILPKSRIPDNTTVN